MQAPLEVMWDALMQKQKDFSKAKSCIENNPDVDLVNSLQPGNGRTLAIYLIQTTVNKKEAKPRDLLSFVLTHPSMNWDALHKHQSAVRALIEAAYADGDMSVIESVKEVDGFILNKNQFAYDVVAEKIKDTEKLMQLKIKNGKPQSERDSVQESINKWKKISALVRDITILHAIKTDNSALMERLEQSGGQPLENLGEFGGNKRSGFLIGNGQPNPDIKAWRKEKHDQERAGQEERMKKAAENLDKYSMFKAKEAQIHAEHDVKKVAILEKAGKDRQERTRTTIKSMS